MGLNAKRRQKKLAKKASKRKAKLTNKNKMKGAVGILSFAKQLVLAEKSPIHECLVPGNLFELGIGNVIVSRKMPDGNIGFSVFLVDTFCLGIKDAFFSVQPQEKYDNEVKIKYNQQGSLQRIHQTCARKLTEGAAAYAKDLGFTPHSDYRMAKRIFGDIDPELCPMSFEFGKDGKPFFMSGPYDSPKKCKMIMDTLTKKCGEDGFHFVVSADDEFEDI